MKKLLIALFGISFCCASAMAQEANPYAGKWLCKVKGVNGRMFEADVAVKDKGGTFQYILMNRVQSDACFTMEAPIAASKVTADAFEFVIDRSAIPGCTNGMVKLHRVDDKTLAGTVGGQDATFTRK